jgi:nucleotide-binding universal stress UspA family protein
MAPLKARDVLFATDFSDHGALVGAVARDTAGGLRARLHIVHVVPPVTDPWDADQRLARAASSLANGVEIVTALRSGRVAREIVAYAREHGVGLIIVGTHGRTGVTRALLGSVAEAVVRLAPCPVLAVPPPAPAGVAAMPVEAYRCVACAAASDDLICEQCRTRIRDEAAAQAPREIA